MSPPPRTAGRQLHEYRDRLNGYIHDVRVRATPGTPPNFAIILFWTSRYYYWEFGPDVIAAVVVCFLRTGDGYTQRQGAAFAFLAPFPATPPHGAIC